MTYTVHIHGCSDHLLLLRSSYTNYCQIYATCKDHSINGSLFYSCQIILAGALEKWNFTNELKTSHMWVVIGRFWSILFIAFFKVSWLLPQLRLTAAKNLNLKLQSSGVIEKHSKEISLYMYNAWCSWLVPICTKLSDSLNRTTSGLMIFFPECLYMLCTLGNFNYM